MINKMLTDYWCLRLIKFVLSEFVFHGGMSNCFYKKKWLTLNLVIVGFYEVNCCFSYCGSYLLIDLNPVNIVLIKSLQYFSIDSQMLKRVCVRVVVYLRQSCMLNIHVLKWSCSLLLEKELQQFSVTIKPATNTVRLPFLSEMDNRN